MNQPSAALEMQIERAWALNADNWNAVIDQQLLRSRIVCTNQAILDAVLALRPERVIDLGCGEGWLCRSLNQVGVKTTGTDLVPELIAACQRKDTLGEYHVVSYDAIEKFASTHTPRYDIAVFNFALLGCESVATALRQAVHLLTERGQIIVQTLHPHTSASGNFKAGWRDGSWAGMEDKFDEPYQWYYRNFSAWLRLFRETGLALVDVHEPSDPATGTPLSVIFQLEVAD